MHTHGHNKYIYIKYIYPTHTGKHVPAHIHTTTQAHTDKYMYMQTHIYTSNTYTDTINIYT